MNTICRILTFGILLSGWCASYGLPVFTSQPVDKSVSIGASVTNRVTASGIAPLIYRWFIDNLEIAGQTNRSLVLTNIQASDAGGYTVIVSDSSGSITSRTARLEVDLAFTKITKGNVVSDGGFSVGVAWVDYDNDDYLDLLVTNSSGTTNFLYHNERDGTFMRITEGPIVNTPADFRSPAWVDYDNDGDIDLYVASNGVYGPIPGWNFLFQNNGTATFTSMSSNVVGSLVGPNGSSESSHWADYDRDGHLDLFVVRYGKDLLFHNTGDGSFMSVTNGPVPPRDGNNYGAAWSDYDNDGYPDLFVASSTGNEANGLYHNNAGTFSRVTTGTIATDRATSAGPIWVDYNNDGLMDLFVANTDTPNFFYRNNGDGTFTKITTGSLVTAYGALRSVWGDYDNDGFLDVFMPLRGGLDNILFHNNGDGAFKRITAGSLVHDGGNSVNTSWGDYDNDGFLDLVVANGAGDAPEDNFLYRNNGNTNAWLKVKLIGTVSNRSAIGAKIRVNATIRGTNMWQLREMTEGAGPNGNTLIAHFGLGDATNIDVVRIEWPSGTVQELTNKIPKQLLTITEPARIEFTTKTQERAHLTIRGGIDFTYTLEASEDLSSWLPIRTNRLAAQSVDVDITENATSSRRFYRVFTDH